MSSTGPLRNLTALFLIMGVVGLMPTRLKIGENEAEWQAEVGEVLASIVESSGSASRQELIQGLDDLSRIAPVAAAAPMRAVTYERLVLYLLAEVGEHLSVKVRTASTGVKFWIIDIQVSAALIEDESGNRVSVEIRQQIQPDDPNRVEIMRVSLENEDPAVSGTRAILLVTSEPLPKLFGARLADYPDMHHVLINTVQDQPRLEAAVKRALSWDVDKPEPNSHS